MAIGDAYATAQEYRATTGKGSSGDDAVITRQLLACSRFFERESGQFFNRDESAVARVFRARYPDVLDLTYEGNCPGIATTAGLSIKVDTDNDGSFADETAWGATDYELLPLQADKGPEARPWSRVHVPSWSTKSFRPGSLVEVTAVFGWPAVPSAVKDDVIELCSIWRAESPRSTGRMDELDQVVATSQLAMSLVRRFKDAYRGTVAF